MSYTNSKELLNTQVAGGRPTFIRQFFMRDISLVIADPLVDFKSIQAPGIAAKIHGGQR